MDQEGRCGVKATLLSASLQSTLGNASRYCSGSEVIRFSDLFWKTGYWMDDMVFTNWKSTLMQLAYFHWMKESSATHLVHFFVR